MDDWQHREILFELKESNRLMKAMIGELSQIKFELVNERMKKEPSVSYKIPIPVKSGTPGISGTMRKDFFTGCPLPEDYETLGDKAKKLLNLLIGRLK